MTLRRYANVSPMYAHVYTRMHSLVVVRLVHEALQRAEAAVHDELEVAQLSLETD